MEEFNCFQCSGGRDGGAGNEISRRIIVNRLSRFGGKCVSQNIVNRILCNIVGYYDGAPVVDRQIPLFNSTRGRDEPLLKESVV